MGTLAHLGSAPCNHGHDVAVAIHVCVCLCVRACARGRADAHGGRGWRGGCVCFWLMFVMQSFVSPTCCRAWGKSEGREMEVSPASRTFTEPHGPVVDSPFSPLRPKQGLRVPGAARPSWSGGTQPWRTLPS